jgi:16S rRNA (cytosine967-C5)-methyltransferase
MTPGARIQASIDLLDEILATPRKPADAIVGAYFRNRRFIGGGDRREVAERIYGILRRLGQLTWWLRRAGRMSPPDARLLVATELLLHDGWSFDRLERNFDGGRFRPDELTRDEREVLQHIAGNTLDHPEQSDAVRYNIPDWIDPQLRLSFGANWQAEYKALRKPAPLDMRVNSLKTDRDTARAALAAEQIAAQPSKLSPLGLRAEGRPPLVTGPAFRSGLVEIQDEGSQLVALLAGAKPGMRVVDYCAGAGGKTLAMAAGMANKGAIVACDVSAPRLERAITRLRRAGVHNVTQRLIDASGRKWIKRSAGTFDRVLIDAPCSGTGTWRRNPDARWSLEQNDIDELKAKQAEILATASLLVKPGGRLIYATCSLLPEENEQQIDGFLAAHQDFALVPLAQAWQDSIGGELPASLVESGVRGGTLHLTPAQHDTDGFFVAILQRKQKPKADQAAKEGGTAAEEAAKSKTGEAA